MKVLRRLGFLVLASGMALAQTNSPNNPTVSDQIKALQDSITRQQKMIEDLQKELAEQKKAPAPQVVNAALTVPSSNTPEAQADAAKPKDSPLSFRIGGTDWTPGGFMDFNNIFRTVNTGNVVSTGFGAIPFNNTTAGQLTEFRSTGQYSRWNMKVGGKYGETTLTGYLEGDFNGNDAANVFATTNPHTLRLRLYYLNAKHGIWEFTAGQAWGLITPNKVGVGPFGADLATTQSTDGNIHVGVPYARDGQFRVAIHPNDKFSWAVSVENPQQVTNGEVLAPTNATANLSLGGQLGGQLDGIATPGVPNAFPDVVTKLAYDSKLGSRALHVEAGGLITSVKLTVQATPTGAGIPFQKHSKIGSGGMAGLNFELMKNIRFMAYGNYGTGIGRYFNALGPQYVVVPVNAPGTICTAAGGCDVNISMVRTANGYGGIETQLGSKTQIAAYYGGTYYQRNSFPDISSNVVLAPTALVSCSIGQAAQNKPCIGFGGTNSANSNNRSIQEGSFVITQTLWKNPQFGALLFINDASYSTRAPWFITRNAAGALTNPKNAHMFMDHVVLRYVLP